MRDLLITALILGALPWILMRPHVGALMYAWLGLMNPHRLTYGFAYSFPFGTIVALSTIFSLVISREKKQLPWSSLFIIWLLFIVWMNITTFFALVPDAAIIEWDRAMKIQLMVLVTMVLIQGQARINAFVWVIVISLGFFGVKGGIFTILTGGQYRVMGPWDTFITDNNTLALALIMTLPLMRYLMLNVTRKALRVGLMAAMGLTAMSIISSQSRGAFIGGGTILLFLIIKSRQRARFMIAAAIAVPIMLLSMPDAWFDRMGTISEYQQDPSAMGRINAWGFAFNLAKDHPITGGGFRVFTENLFLTYAPNPADFHDAHSIYFEILGEQGFIGLALFLSIGFLSLKYCNRIIRAARGRTDLIWAGDLAAMLQVSLIGYATGGAFLGLAYYDLYYDIVAVVIVLHHHVRMTLTATDAKSKIRESSVDDRHGRKSESSVAGNKWPDGAVR